MLTAFAQAVYDVDTLTERIAANERLWGPGCRPELRERLAEAKARVAAAEEQAASHLLQNRPVRLLRLSDSPDAKLHVEGEFAAAECGAYNRRDWADTGVVAGWRSAAQALAEVAVCGRCKASLRAWARN